METDPIFRMMEMEILLIKMKERIDILNAAVGVLLYDKGGTFTFTPADQFKIDGKSVDCHIDQGKQEITIKMVED